jgi:hypothetical protein
VNSICEQIDDASSIPSFYVNGQARTPRERKSWLFQTGLLRTREPGMIAEKKAAKVLRNVVFGLSLALIGATPMANPAPQQ